MKKFLIIATLFFVIGLPSFVLGSLWHRWDLPPFGMGLVDGTQPPPHKWGYEPSTHNAQARVGLDALQHIYTRRTARVVMFGDSNTEFVDWKELLDRDDIANRGLSGDVVASALKRVESVIALQPKIVFILLGTNDILFEVPIGETMSAYRTILEKLRAHGIRTIVQSIPPTILPDFGQRTEVNAAVQNLNARLKTLAEEAGATFLELDGIEIGSDGVHVAAAGYAAWAEAIKPYLEE